MEELNLNWDPPFFYITLLETAPRLGDVGLANAEAFETPDKTRFNRK